MYVSEICAEGIFVSFYWWLKNVKSTLKIALSSNERHFELSFPKKKTNTFFRRKLSKLHKKDTILHVTITFSLKQGQTRTSSELITVPLKTLSFFPQNLSMLNRTGSHNPLTRFHICTHKFSMAVICLFGSYGIWSKQHFCDYWEFWRKE